MKKATFSLTENILEKLNAVSIKTRIKKSNIVEMALSECLEKLVKK